jgi:hypothetical protein
MAEWIFFFRSVEWIASGQRIKWDSRMLLVNVTAFAVLAILLLAKDTPAGQWLDQFLLQGIITRLGHITRGHWICAGAVLLAIGLLFWLAKVDGLILFSMGAPDLAVWFTTFEISIYADALTAIVIASSALRVKAIQSFFVLKCLNIMKKFKRSRKREVHSQRKDTVESVNDDDGKFGRAA